MIIILAAVLVLLAVAYFAVISPLLGGDDDDVSAPVELIAGEERDTDGTTILMFPYAASGDIQSIDVHNEYGSFTCYYVEAEGEFYLKDYEQAPFSKETLASLVVAAGYTSTLQRVTAQCTNWGDYGLGEADEPSWYELTLRDGTVHKVYIGDRIPSGGGYYARYDGREALYVLKSSISSTLLVPVENLVTAYLGDITIGENYYYIEELYMLKNGESFVYITFNEEKFKETQGDSTTMGLSTSIYDMVYPSGYEVNETYQENVLLKLAALQGSYVVKLGSSAEPLYKDAELMAQYGFENIDRAPYELYYSYKDIDTIVLFAPSGVDGYYFAYSYLYNLIALVEEDSVSFLEWKLLDLIQNSVFRETVTDVSKIEVSGTLENGREVSESFTVTFDEKKDKNITVVPAATGKELSSDEVANFKKFYMVLLSVYVRGDIKNEEIGDLSDYQETARLKVTMKDGEVTECIFYKYSDRRCYVKINGTAEFYVNWSSVRKLLTDANRAAHGATVDTTAEKSECVD